MTKTEVRPVPLPPRPAAGVRMPPPEGASGWARVWLDADGIPRHSAYPVPVDADNRRTAHLRHTCRGQIEVMVDLGDGKFGTEVRQCDRVEWLLPEAPTVFCRDHGCPLEAEGGRERRGGL